MDVRALLVLAAGILANTAAAEGQSPAAWIIVVATASPTDGDRATTLAEAARSELARAGSPALPSDQSVLMFRAAHSREPIMLAESHVQRFAELATRALDDYAFGRAEQAQERVRQALDEAQPALESLMRDVHAARAYLDSCLLLVRGFLDRGDRDGGLRLAKECRSQAPGVRPTYSDHPPGVLQVLEQAELELEQMSGVAEVTSTPPNCTVYVNGRALGTTPYRSSAPQGEHRVQVECAPATSRGRVHVLKVGPTENARVHVDASFESALSTEDGLRLSYGSVAALRQHMSAHAEEIARTLGRPVLVVQRPDLMQASLRLFDTNGHTFVAELEYDPSADEAAHLGDALGAFRRGESYRPAAIADGEEHLVLTDDRRSSSGVPWWGWGLSALGGAIAVQGVYGLAIDGDCAKRADAGYCTAVYQSGVQGGIFLAIAAPLMVVPLAWVLFDGDDSGISVYVRGPQLALKGTIE